MKRFFVLFAASLILFSCTNTPPPVITPPVTHSERPDPEVQRMTAGTQLYGALREGERLIREGDISGVFRVLLPLTENNSGKLFSAFRQRQAAKLISAVESRLAVVPGDEWIEGIPGHFYPLEPNSELSPMPTFSVFYRGPTGTFPVKGFGFRLSFVRGERTAQPTGLTNVSDTAELSELDRSGPQSRSEIHVILQYKADNLVYELTEPHLLFILPEPHYYFDVKVGERVNDLVDRLTGRGFVTNEAFVTVAAVEPFLDFPYVPPPSSRMNRFEGLFPPGTHGFPKRSISPLKPGDYDKAVDNAKVIISLLLKRDAARHDNRSAEPSLSVYEQMILASIVEKEAVDNRDYDLVASVFLNRLKDGSRLASCPTVEYALNYHRPFLLLSDIDIESPYNVYKNAGLPPTPICFFSDDAIDAVRNPKNSGLYFFVYDWTRRELLFARDYEKHLENAERARSNYIEVHGEDALRRVFMDKFYEE